jgi:hypothetical protein
MAFSSPPKASELRAWTKLQGYSLLPNTGDGYTAPEIWVDAIGRWRLKIKRPATRAGLHVGSYQERYSCRQFNPVIGDLEYYDPVSGTFGTRQSHGHLDLMIDQPTPVSQGTPP